jgi:hypothetical protein
MEKHCQGFQESLSYHYWSIEGWIHSPRRNKFNKKLVEKLVHCDTHTNLVVYQNCKVNITISGLTGSKETVVRWPDQSSVIMWTLRSDYSSESMICIYILLWVWTTGTTQNTCSVRVHETWYRGWFSPRVSEVCQVTVLPSRELVYSVVVLYGIIFVSNFVSIRIWGRLTGPERFTSEWSFKGWYWTVWRRLFVDDNVGFVEHIFFLVKTIVQSGVEKSNLPKFLLIPGPRLFPSPPPPQDPTTYPTTYADFIPDQSRLFLSV